MRGFAYRKCHTFGIQRVYSGVYDTLFGSSEIQNQWNLLTSKYWNGEETMANFKAVVRGERKDGFMQVYIRVTHRRVHGYIKTDKMITKKELSKSKEIKDPFVLNWCSERILEFNDRLNKKDISRWTVSRGRGISQNR